MNTLPTDSAYSRTRLHWDLTRGSLRRGFLSKLTVAGASALVRGC